MNLTILSGWLFLLMLGIPPRAGATEPAQFDACKEKAVLSVPKEFVFNSGFAFALPSGKAIHSILGKGEGIRVRVTMTWTICDAEDTPNALERRWERHNLPEVPVKRRVGDHYLELLYRPEAADSRSFRQYITDADGPIEASVQCSMLECQAEVMDKQTKVGFKVIVDNPELWQQAIQEALTKVRSWTKRR